ncbi:MAG: helix-turn-helix domain-containing protein, partial [Armatimonadota bacterium]
MAHRGVGHGKSLQPGHVMTVDQVAAYLQLNRLTVYRYVREGKIPASRIGKLYRILRADVDLF